MLAFALYLAVSESPLDPSAPGVIGSFGLAGLVMVAFARGWVVSGDLQRRTETRANEAEVAMRAQTAATVRLVDAADRMLAFVTEQERTRRGRS